MAAALPKLDELLLSELECPVCLELMLPPISLCENGHNICKVCRPQLETCPTCRGALGNTRCMSLEKILEELLYPCVYRKHGCQQSFPAYLITDHQSVCQFSPFSCPSEGCKWKGSTDELFRHTEQEHKEEVHVFDNNDLMVISDYDVDNNYKRIITAYGQVFVSDIKVVDNVWHYALQCVGSRDMASSYEYSLSISNMREKGSIKVTHLTRSIKDDLQDVYRCCACVKLPLDVVQSFIVENDLMHYLEIRPHITKLAWFQANDLGLLEEGS